MFIFTSRIYKFFADLRNVRRFVAIQIVIRYYMALAVGHCAITWLLPSVSLRYMFRAAGWMLTAGLAALGTRGYSKTFPSLFSIILLVCLRLVILIHIFVALKGAFRPWPRGLPLRSFS